MSALRKAGVWLGLIEEEDDYAYDERAYGEEFPDEDVDDSASLVRSRVADRLAEARASRNRDDRARDDRNRDERGRDERRDRDRGQDRGHDRGHDRGPARLDDRDYDDDDEPAPVRQIARQGAEGAAIRSGRDEAAVTRSRIGDAYPTRDNLALAPAAQQAVAPRAVPVEQPETRMVAVPDDHRYQITTLSPTTYSEARTIGEHFRDGVPVILNLTEMAEADAKRLVDFAAGLAFGLRGTMERVTNRVFLISPANIQVTAEDKAKIAEGGFFRQ
jgi:cell division inhibitor SepF